MYKTLLFGVSWLIGFGDIAIQNLNYRLIVIEDESVPLSSGDTGGTRFLPITLAIMAAILLGTLVTIYYYRCRYYQTRILNLKEDGMQPYSGWNLIKLKEVTLEIELEMVDDKERE